MKYMLDTNICTYAQKRNPGVLSKLKNVWEQGIAISSITLAEMEFGIHASSNPEKHSIKLLQILSIMDILPFDSGAAEEYGKIRAYLQSTGQPIGPLDMLIAAHAKSKDLILVTHNTREFARVPELKIEDWYE